MISNNLKSKINTKFLYADFISVLRKYQYNLNLGDIVAGSIFSEESNGYLVDIGDKTAAFLPKEETTINNINYLKKTQEFFILSYDSNLLQLVLSTRRLKYLRAWKRIKQLQEEDVIIYAMVTNKNLGGLLVNFNSVSAFVPNSHIINIAFKKAMVGTTIPLKFLVVNEHINQIILSHKRAVLSFSNFTIGNIINTKIIQIKNYGMFVQAYNLQALLHISEIPNTTLNNLNTIMKINRPFKTMIIHIDEKQGRLSVSIKRLVS
uniref:Ribosomal protein S1 n=1 Tax=Hildenbrandia rubra TaxID=31481 RepID=A0A1C9CG72_9FLOR|nr:ribosomal protein S1 [Hildenbrandia rubra]AOM67383.1 ribosomal protein S1 [Hildenbrandia rubra]